MGIPKGPHDIWSCLEYVVIGHPLEQFDSERLENGE